MKRRTPLISRTSASYRPDVNELLQITQVLSRTVHLTDLLEKMTGILREKTGAERALILCRQGEDWFIEAIGQTKQPAIGTRTHIPVSGTTLLPLNVFQHVIRSGLAVMLADAAKDERFGADAYIREHGVKSLLCYPNPRGAAPGLVFFLEKNRANGAFHTGHLELLQALSGITVVSLENALMFEGLNAAIAEHERTEEVLREKEERLRVSLEGAAVGIWDFDLRTNRMHFNDRYYEMLGYAPGEFPASYEGFKSLLHLDDAEMTETALQRAVETKSSFVIEFRVRAKNGEWRWALGRGKVVALDKEGKAARVAGSQADITERKRAEEALEKRVLALTRPLDEAEEIAFEDMFNLADLQLLQDRFAETCGVAALITRPDGTPITKPSGFSELCGEIIRKTPKGLANCNYSDSMIGRYNASGPNIHSCLSAGLCNAGASITVGGRHIANWLIGQVRNETQVEEEIVKYAGEIGVEEDVFRDAYRKVPVMPKEQFEKVAGFLFILANQISTTAYQNIQQARFIDERGKAEKEIKRLNEDLERRVTERTSQLQAVNKELEAFAYSISHDLRAPLHTIQGFTGILMEDNADSLGDNAKHACTVIRNETHRMGTLIDDLLRLSRSSIQQMQMSPLDMEDLVKAAFAENTPPAARQRVDFRVDAMPPAVGDPRLIRQVWANLLTNAVKYSAKRERADIRAGGEEKEGENVYWVEDNGAGFDMKYADKIFGVFQRLHSSSEFEGSGVGLAIVQRIVQRHGGKVWTHGEVDKGAKFFFSLPRKSEA